MSKKWACRTYYNPNPFISFSWHDTIMMVPVPPFVVPTKAFHLDFSVVQGLWIGSFLSNGRGKKVVGDDLLFVGRTSDAGLFVPHISFPPTWMNILTTLFGSSMCLFGTSSVTLACKNIIWGNEDCDLAATPFGPVPLSLNLACHDPYSAPTDIVIVWGSVYSGMSFADLLAALIDFAINLACEVGMKHIGEPLMSAAGSGLKKVGGKINSGLKKLSGKAATTGAGAATTGAKTALSGAGAATTGSKALAGAGAATVGTKKAIPSKAAGKSASKGNFFDQIGTNFSKLAGWESTSAVKKYTKKAATTRGMYNTMKEMCYSTGKNLDSDLIDLVKQGTPGVFSKDFLSELQNINSSKYDDYVKKMMSSSADSLDSAERSGSKDIKDAFDKEFIDEITDDLSGNEVILYKSLMTKDIAIDSVMRTTLWKAMKEMSDAAEDAASKELARSLGYTALKKSMSQMLWKYTIRNGGLISIDTTILGYHLDYDTSPSRQFADKWWANQEWFGTELWNAGDLGLTETDDSEYWEESYVEGDGSDDDYWYVSVADDSASTSTDGTSTDTDESEDDDDDYWYGTDENADAAE